MSAIPRSPSDPTTLDHVACSLDGRPMDPYPDLPCQVGDYTFRRLIGSGGFGFVYEAVLTDGPDIVYAAKVIPLGCGQDEQLLETFEAEVSALQKLGGPGIVRIYKYFDVGSRKIMILEFCVGGDLESKIVKNQGMPKESLMCVAQHIILALEEVHTQGLAHRDIKPANVLFDGCGVPKLGDFGLALFNTGEKIHSFMGSIPYIAPEMWRGRDFDPRKADVWALGVTLFRMVTGRYPFPTSSVQAMKEAVMLGMLPRIKWNSHPLLQIAKMMLTSDPNARVCLSEVVDMPVFAEMMCTVADVAPEAGLEFKVTRRELQMQKLQERLEREKHGIPKAFGSRIGLMLPDVRSITTLRRKTRMLTGKKISYFYSPKHSQSHAHLQTLNSFSDHPINS